MDSRTESSPPVRVGILLSGRGSNFVALHQAIADQRIPATVAVVISNVADAPGLERARALGIETRAIPHRGAGGRLAHDRMVIAALKAAEVEWVCLAGYMRLLTSEFVQAFRHRILNIHPSLLPSFPGLAAQRQALEHGVRVSGCTVHLVDEGLDSGPIVVQRNVAVADDETEPSLSAKILVQEHQAYPAALRRLLTEPWAVEGRRIRFGRPADGDEPSEQKGSVKISSEKG